MSVDVNEYSKKRRDGLREQKLCINGASHGPATHGCLCWPCRAVRRGLVSKRSEAGQEPPEGERFDGNPRATAQPEAI